MVAVALEVESLNAAGQIAAELQEQPQALAALIEALRSTEWDTSLRPLFRVDAFEDLRAVSSIPNSNVLSSKSTPGKLPDNDVHRAFVGEYMRFWNTLAPALAAEKDEAKIVEKIEAVRSQFLASRSKPQNTVGELISSYPTALNEHRRVAANRRTLDAYIACLAFRHEHKRWPKNLAEAGITGEQNYDALSSGPLHYRATDQEMRVWNVGRNGVDDGGLTRREAVGSKRGIDHYDNVFIYPWPEL